MLVKLATSPYQRVTPLQNIVIHIVNPWYKQIRINFVFVSYLISGECSVLKHVLEELGRFFAHTNVLDAGCV